MNTLMRLLAVIGIIVFVNTVARGQDLDAGKAKSQICASCHGADGNAVLPIYPNLAGQNWRYIYMQLKDFKEGRRNNNTMSPLAGSLSREDMINIANYFATLPVKPNPFIADEAKVKLGKAKADETLCSMCHLGEFKVSGWARHLDRAVNSGLRLPAVWQQLLDATVHVGRQPRQHVL